MSCANTYLVQDSTFHQIDHQQNNDQIRHENIHGNASFMLLLWLQSRLRLINESSELPPSLSDIARIGLPTHKKKTE